MKILPYSYNQTKVIKMSDPIETSLYFSYELPRLYIPPVGIDSLIRIPQIIGAGHSTIDGQYLSDVTFRILDRKKYSTSTPSNVALTSFRIRYVHTDNLIITEVTLRSVPVEHLFQSGGSTFRKKVDGFTNVKIDVMAKFCVLKYILSWLMTNKLNTMDDHSKFMNKLRKSRFGQYAEMFMSDYYGAMGYIEYMHS